MFSTMSNHYEEHLEPMGYHASRLAMYQTCMMNIETTSAHKAKQKFLTS